LTVVTTNNAFYKKCRWIETGNEEQNELEQYTELRWNVVYGTEERTMGNTLGLLTWSSTCSLGHPCTASPPWPSTRRAATLAAGCPRAALPPWVGCPRAAPPPWVGCPCAAQRSHLGRRRAEPPPWRSMRSAAALGVHTQRRRLGRPRAHRTAEDRERSGRRGGGRGTQEEKRRREIVEQEA
jgi:hypothetical protein